MIIKVSASQLVVIDDFLRNNKKLDAINALRNTARPLGYDSIMHDLPLPSTIGLKDAKDAVERREWDLELFDATKNDRRGRPNAPSWLVCRQPIKRLVCDFGEGEVELDMDGLSLRALTELNGSIKMGDALALIDLYKRIASWDENW